MKYIGFGLEIVMATSVQQSDVDELFDLKNAYYIGNFQQCINEAEKVKVLSSEIKLERDVFVYRSYIAQKKYRIVLEEITDRCAIELQALKLLAEYLSVPNKRELLLTRYLDKFSSYENENHYIVIVGATIHLFGGQVVKALQLLYPDDHLESLALALQIYLSMSRLDLARKELKKMQDRDEDSTLTQLAQAWVNIAIGSDKLQDAYYIFQEIIDKYGSSVSLFNSQSVCYIGQGRYEEADSAIQEAMDKDSNDSNTLVNAIVLSAHLSKPVEMVGRYLTQLKESHVDSPFVKSFSEKEKEFDQLCQEYEVKF